MLRTYISIGSGSYRSNCKLAHPARKPTMLQWLTGPDPTWISQLRLHRMSDEGLTASRKVLHKNCLFGVRWPKSSDRRKDGPRRLRPWKDLKASTTQAHKLHMPRLNPTPLKMDCFCAEPLDKHWQTPKTKENKEKQRNKAKEALTMSTSNQTKSVWMSGVHHCPAVCPLLRNGGEASLAALQWEYIRLIKNT